MKLFTFSVVEANSPAPTEPAFSVGHANGASSIVLTRDAFEWLALYKKIVKGERVDNPQALATWLFQNERGAGQLAAALPEHFRSEITRLRLGGELPKVTANIDPVSLLESLLALHERCKPDELIAPGGPAAQALASSQIDPGRAFELVDALRSYLLSFLTTTDGAGHLPLGDVRLLDVEGDMVPYS
jgi:hypothetical protein